MLSQLASRVLPRMHHKFFVRITELADMMPLMLTVLMTIRQHSTESDPEQFSPAVDRS